MKSVFSCLLLAILWSGCSTTKTVNCAKAVLPLQFVGFSGAELDTVLIYRYAAGSGFVGPADTIVLASAVNGLTASGDTLRIANPTFDAALTEGYDYLISIPANGRELRIDEIVDEGQETMSYRQPFLSKVDLSPCINAIISYRMEGKTVEVRTPEYDTHYVTIRY